MLKKFKTFMDERAILAALIVFLAVDTTLLGLGHILSQ